jgi:hypothetical protein
VGRWVDVQVSALTQTHHKRGNKSAQHAQSQTNPLLLVARDEPCQYFDSEPSGVLLVHPWRPR